MMPAAGSGRHPSATPLDRNLTGAQDTMNKWILAAILAAMAVFMYASVFVKFGG